MLKRLSLSNIGPASKMEMDLAPRLNLITGDNGLGKSFLLDVAWWSLTRHWPHEVNRNMTSGYMARPRDREQAATIEFQLTSKTKKDVGYISKFSPRDDAWIGKAGRPWNPGLVIYAHADGGFSVWDPARNYWRQKGGVDIQERLPAFVFSPSEIWDGLNVNIDGKPTLVCNGLISDWASWIKEKGDLARLMAQVLRLLSPSDNPQDQLQVGGLTRMSVNEARDIPTLKTAHGVEVPILHASSGVRRITALAYMLLWSWNEHRLAAKLLGESRANQVIVLVDEIEAHLHPKWQRTILKALLSLAKSMHSRATLQLIAATHSPLILASAEPTFDAKQDAWFDLDLETDKTSSNVYLRHRDFYRHGDVSKWLTSEAFDLKSARSIEAEIAISAAMNLVNQERPSRKAVNAVDEQLKMALGDVDRFWVRWSEYKKRLGVDR